VQEGRGRLRRPQRPGLEAHMQLERSERAELPAVWPAAHKKGKPLV